MTRLRTITVAGVLSLVVCAVFVYRLTNEGKASDAGLDPSSLSVPVLEGYDVSLEDDIVFSIGDVQIAQCFQGKIEIKKLVGGPRPGAFAMYECTNIERIPSDLMDWLSSSEAKTVTLSNLHGESWRGEECYVDALSGLTILTLESLRVSCGLMLA